MANGAPRLVDLNGNAGSLGQHANGFTVPAYADQSGFWLLPAYTVERGPQQVSPSKMALVNVVAPILWHVSSPSVWVPMASAILIPVRDLAKNEQNDWAAAVLQCNERTAKMRAADAGIELVGPGALDRLPKPNGQG